MAPVNPAYCMQGRIDHPAQAFRLALAGVSTGPMSIGGTSPQGGVHPYFGNQMAVSGLSSMTVSVGTGLAYMPATTAWAGMYAGYNAAAYTVAVPAASATQWRRDYIAAVVTDPGDATAAWDIVDVAGAFSSTSPGALPALPNNAIPLAIINVVPNMTVTNGAGTVSDARVYSPFPGVFLCNSATRPNAPVPDGTMWYEADTDNLGVLRAGAHCYAQLYHSNGNPPDTWHTITPDSGWSAISGYAPGLQYRLVGDGSNIQFSGALQHATFSGITSINVANPLPAAYRPANKHVVSLTDPVGSVARVEHNSSGVLYAIGTVGNPAQYIEIDSTCSLL